MRARRWHQCGDAVDQFQRREHQVSLFATGLRLGAVVDQISTALAQTLHRKRRPGAIPQQALQPCAVLALDTDTGTDRKPAVLVGQHLFGVKALNQVHMRVQAGAEAVNEGHCADAQGGLINPRSASNTGSRNRHARGKEKGRGNRQQDFNSYSVQGWHCAGNACCAEPRVGKQAVILQNRVPGIAQSAVEQGAVDTSGSAGLQSSVCG